jgi:hypothetical protein
MSHKNKSSSKENSFIKNGNGIFLIPIAILLVFALISWSWLLLLSPGISKYAEPFINKYLNGMMGQKQVAVTAPVDGDKHSDAAVKETDPGQHAGGAIDEEPDPDNDMASAEETGDKLSIRLQIYEGPLYSAADDTCYYRIAAVVTGNPKPEVKFSRDDSRGNAGPAATQINLKRNATTYTLTATASNVNGTVMDSMTLSWGCNASPVITEMKLSSDIIYVSKQYDVSVTASDPEGNAISYKWTVSGGSLDNDSLQNVKWTTPSKPENYEVKVEITDSMGAKSAKTISVYVGSANAPETTAKQTAPETTSPETTAATTTEPSEQSINLGKKTEEGGYIEYGGQTYAAGNIYAGDSAGNKPCAGFISFDIGSLSGKNVKSAKLTFSSGTVQGKPLEYLDAFWINIVEWGERPIAQKDFRLAGVAVQSFAGPGIACTADKLKSELQKAINDGNSRFQIRVHFAGPYTDNDDTRDGWEYLQQNINLKVTY